MPSSGGTAHFITSAAVVCKERQLRPTVYANHRGALQSGKGINEGD